ncbi:MAG TPA: ribosome maturation factor RimM [Tepidiformaceae bacterium]|nr:ribosome maturation factor RimM [Tepidiformaceae bacterium]
MDTEPREGFTAVGRVLRPHALRGELRVEAFSPTARNIQRGRPVYLDGVRRVVQEARSDRGAWIVKLGGLTDRTAAERARGKLLEAPDAEVIRDDDESFFVHELIGLRVVTGEGREIGRIAEVMPTGANDVWVVRGAHGEMMVPAVAEVVREVKTAEGLVIITPLMGMLDNSK